MRDFHPVADGQGLAFSVELGGGLPPSIVTDPQRLRQVIKNLLSNAFKFTERGEVRVRFGSGASGWSPANERTRRAPAR